MQHLRYSQMDLKLPLYAADIFKGQLSVYLSWLKTALPCWVCRTNSVAKRLPTARTQRGWQEHTAGTEEERGTTAFGSCSILPLSTDSDTGHSSASPVTQGWRTALTKVFAIWKNMSLPFILCFHSVIIVLIFSFKKTRIFLPAFFCVLLLLLLTSYHT